MSDIVIKAEGLGKKYLIGHQSERERYTALRDVLARNVKGVLNKTRQVFSGQQLLAGDTVEEFWALRDIDFEIKRGDRVGIIGRNGAGKSTLLKVLSRITEPSMGRVEIHGRVASLLEVGTGFHPELTGRENIFLNGAILGMTRAEIKKKFDEIVDFAGVEKFLDTPVKRYSSGMYVRLAFAVAAHLEPEILVVDEVLAVGDAEFQKKCLGKMEDVSKNEGRTVLFVSHNMDAISRLCNSVFLLKQGQISKFSSQIQGINEYYQIIKDKSISSTIDNKYLSIIENVIIVKDDMFLIENEITIKVKVIFKVNINNLVFGILIKNSKSSPIASSYYNDFRDNIEVVKEKVYEFRVRIPSYTLATGDYVLEIDIGIAYLKRILIPSIEIPFSLSNLDGIGSKYNTQDHDFFNSIVRQNWFWEIDENI
ncbi:MAG: polysaccharide ABC transporter ATP-binding protein [Haliscomenobacter sp.]|uniref:ABC transporter ATP-binding protein n=1 Tax=Haliscomenobacter sp. TaxID=2717303 RepID=UPI0029A729FB|nr:polysaccharide ABC transporter ATP-binding protein [Haliscomenobacter sp.]MDX2067859.1 polysaccharide ABC transporter ATP-binding protein [Haliscomenobacter sp.]